MNSIIPVKVSLIDLVLSIENLSQDDLTTSITFNHVSNIFKPPFTNLPVQLVSFPMISTMYFKILHNNICIGEASCSLEGLHIKKNIENFIELKTTQETTSNEDSKNPEASTGIKTIGNFKVLIEKEDPDMKNCQLCPIFENFTTISERALEIIIEMNKNINNKYIGRVNQLGMEVHQIDTENEVTPQRIKNIKCLLVGVNEKLKILDMLKERCENLSIQVFEEQKSRENMQGAFKKTCKEFLDNKSQLEKMVIELEKKVSTLSKRNYFLENIEKTYENYKKNAQTDIEVLKSKLAKLEKGIIHDPRTEEIIKNLQANALFAENTTKMQKNEFSKVVQGYEYAVAQYQQQISDLSHENLNFTQKIEILTRKNHELKTENEFLVNESAMDKAKLLEYEKHIMYVKEMEMQMKRLEETANKAKEDYRALQLQMEKLSQRYHEGTRGLFNDKKQLMENNRKLTEESIKAKHENNTFRNQVVELKSRGIGDSFASPGSTYSSLSSQNIKLLQDCKDLVSISNKFEADIVKEFHVVLKNIVESSERHLMLQRLQSKILQFLRDKDIENHLLRDLVIEFQKDKPIYVPVRGDFIDNTLANYLNSRSNYCGVPFVRLESGVYLFGTKRVVLRIENIGIVSNI